MQDRQVSPLFFAIGIPLLFTLIFASFFWNRYLAVTNDGWHFLHGWEILHGRVPYRDFFLFIPPLHPLKDAGLIWLFGDSLIMPQLLGILERVVLAVVMVLWLRPLFGPFAAAVGTMASMGFYLCDQSETLSSLHEEAVFFPFLACAAATQASIHPRLYRWSMLAGLCAGLAMLAKQTSGVAITCGCAGLLAAILWRQAGIRTALRTTLVFSAAWLVPVGAVLLWLASRGALAAFLSDCFIQGTSSKGSLPEMLLRAPTMIWSDANLRRTFLLALFLLAGSCFTFRKRQPSGAFETTAGREREFAGLSAVTLIALCAMWLLARQGAPSPVLERFHFLSIDTAVFWSVFCCLALFLFYLPKYFRNTLTEPETQVLFISALSLGLVALLSLSWPVFVSMLIPAFAFALAHLMRQVPGTGMRLAIVMLVLCGVSFEGWNKLSYPFGWNGWVEPSVFGAHRSLPYPETKGLLVSQATGEFMERVTGDIGKYSLATDAIYEYPAAPLLYILSHRRPATRSFIHFVDTTPDYIAEEDAKKLLANPPAVIVYFEQTEEELRMGEANFRGGRRSGQRSIVSAIEKLRPQYRVVDELSTPGTSHRVDVLARLDKIRYAERR